MLEEITGVDLTKIYGERAALSHGNFEVPAGSICGFVGPNGSGKTTTLYAALSDLNDGSKNILTAEDPIEYQIDGFSFFRCVSHTLWNNVDNWRDPTFLHGTCPWPIQSERGHHLLG